MKDPPPQKVLLQRLIAIDEKIRNKWSQTFRNNNPKGLTFTQAIKAHSTFAETLWLQDVEFTPASRSQGALQGRRAAGQGREPQPLAPAPSHP